MSDDVQRMVNELADAVPKTRPDVARLIAAGHVVRRRRRRTTTISAAAAVLLVVAGAAVATQVVTAGDQGRATHQPPVPSLSVSPGMQLVGAAGVTVEVPDDWKQLVVECPHAASGSQTRCPVVFRSPRSGSQVEVTVGGLLPLFDRMRVVGEERGLEVRRNGGLCELSKPPSCTALVAVPARGVLVKVHTDGVEGEQVAESIPGSLTVGPIEVSQAGNTLSGTELELATMAARELSADYGEETELAYASIRVGRQLQSNSGHPCKSGRIITVNLLGTYPDVNGLGVRAEPGENPVAGTTTHSLNYQIDAQTGVSCLGSISATQFPPGPDDTVLDLTAPATSTSAATIDVPSPAVPGTNRNLAKAATARILQTAPLPPGSTPTGPAPNPSLQRLRYFIGGVDTSLTRTRWWTVPLAYPDLVAWYDAHTPADTGSAFAEGSRTPVPSGDLAWVVAQDSAAFTDPAIVVGYARVDDDTTAIRVDVTLAARWDRTAETFAPASVTSVDIKPRVIGGPDDGMTTTVTDPQAVAQVATAYNQILGHTAGTQPTPCGSPAGTSYEYAVTLHWPGHTLSVDTGLTLCGSGRTLTLDGVILPEELTPDDPSFDQIVKGALAAS